VEGEEVGRVETREEVREVAEEDGTNAGVVVITDQKGRCHTRLRAK